MVVEFSFAIPYAQRVSSSGRLSGGDRASLTSASSDVFLYWGVFHFRSLSTAHSCHMPSRKYGKKLCQAQLQTDNKKQGL